MLLKILHKQEEKLCIKGAYLSAVLNKATCSRMNIIMQDGTYSKVRGSVPFECEHII